MGDSIVVSARACTRTVARRTTATRSRDAVRPAQPAPGAHVGPVKRVTGAVRRGTASLVTALMLALLSACGSDDTAYRMAVYT